MKRLIILISLMIFCGFTLFAGGDAEKNKPVILLECTGNGHISPANNDGIQDTADFYIIYQPANNYVINGYRLEIADSSGNAVFTRSGKSPLKSNFFTTFLSSIKIKKKKSYDSPTFFSWDGKADDGKILPDGEYTMILYAEDDKGRSGKSNGFIITIDNEKPKTSVSIPFEVFSPNGDGKQDVLIVEQHGEAEQKWQARILTRDGDTVFLKTWNNSKPESFSWNGITPNNKAFPDSKYILVLSARDMAGNIYEYKNNEIEIDTKERNINISFDTKYFSPNNDRNKDVINFTPDIEYKSGMKEWQFVIYSGDSEVRTYKGYSKIPDTISFDGKNDGGKNLSEGVYHAILTVKYSNGATPQKRTSEFSIDLTKPKAAIKKDLDIFSPNGDGNQDRVFIQQNTSREYQWIGEILNDDYIAIRKYEWKGTAESYFYWDGITDDGSMAADGDYLYALSCEDPAGNSIVVKTSIFKKDTQDTPVEMTIDRQYFNPLSKNNNFVKIVPNIKYKDSVKTFRLWISDSKGREIKNISFDYNQQQFSWNGYSQDNTVLPDAAYYANIEAGFKNGNIRKIKSQAIYIDTIYPSVDIKIPETSFSPDGDGVKDLLTIQHGNLSDDEKWSSAIKNSKGKVVRDLFFDKKPLKIYWDGKDNNGNIVDDGKYSYEMRLEDAAGNITVKKLSGIGVDTIVMPVSVKISSSSFSPNRDNIKDDIVFSPVIENDSAISSWKLRIKDSQGVTVHTITDNGNPPGKIKYTGKRGSRGTLAEGVYTAELDIRYKSGKTASGKSAEFSVDLTKPTAKIVINEDVFSPNNDGNKDIIEIKQTVSGEENWEAVIKDSLGNIVKEYSWRGKIPDKVTWDGKNRKGKLANDGEFVYILDSVDNAGNRASISSKPFYMNTVNTEIMLTLKNNSFSPNNDGKNDSVVVQASINYREGIKEYTFTIKDSKNNELYSVYRKNRSPSEFSWNGKDKNGKTMGDGKYKAELSVVYQHGNVAKAVVDDILIDTEYPEADISTAYLLFSPDGDSSKDVIKIDQKTTRETEWEGTVYDQRRNPVYKAFWKGKAEQFVWDGTDTEGNIVQDGTYSYVLSCTDDAGNTYSVRLDNISIDTRKPYVYTNFDLEAFSPNNDNVDDTVKISFYASMKDKITKWKVDIYEQNYKKVIKSIEGKDGEDLPENISWDGKTYNGKILDGQYKSRLSVQYEKGNLVEIDSDKSVFLDTTPPEVDVMLSAQPFSPDGDGVDDKLGITINPSNDPSGIKGWKIIITDPKGNKFRELSGSGIPQKEVIWDGLSDRGELVQSAEDYGMAIMVTDNQNNTQIVEGYSSIDILVLRDGDKLKIQISSITFAPNSADYKNVEKAKAEKNIKTMNRLAEILKKYSNYSILIEGHAASVYWNNKRRYEKEEKEELVPLSKARADAVKNGLVKLGLPGNRIRTSGIGGRNPVVPHSDEENRWKNRRVEFILIRQ